MLSLRLSTSFFLPVRIKNYKDSHKSIERLAVLGKVFTIDVCAYTVMSNYCHLVVHIEAEATQALLIDEVIEHALLRA
jgi:hypothetical protein